MLLLGVLSPSNLQLIRDVVPTGKIVCLTGNFNKGIIIRTVDLRRDN